MNKYTFLQRLEKALRHIPKEDREDAISYYTEYFEEMGADDNQYISTIVTIPDDTSLKDISIHDADGDCLIGGQTADSYTLDLSYGDLALTDCTEKNVDMKDSDGDANLSDSDFTATLDEAENLFSTNFDTADGDIIIQFAK